MTELNVETAKEWAEGTIGDWFPGYTSPDPDTSIQYRISYLGENWWRFETAEYRTVVGEYKLTLTVTEK